MAEDVQVLRLQKERWELVDSSCKPIKTWIYECRKAKSKKRKQIHERKNLEE
ncbi:hypothetical protein LguiA_006116 [Lonicera macranthoides]